MIFRRIFLFTLSTFFMWSINICAAYAESAVFLPPNSLSQTEITAISSSGDNAGATISQSQSLQLLFDQPFATSRADNVSIFTLPPVGGGLAIGEIRVGIAGENGVQFVGRRFFLTGSNVSLNGFIENRCARLGGCNFIEILTRGTTPTAQGVQVDYIQINGEVVSVAAPTPEPQIWALMILGFVSIAWRSKKLRRQAANMQYSRTPRQQTNPLVFDLLNHQKPLSVLPESGISQL